MMRIPSCVFPPRHKTPSSLAIVAALLCASAAAPQVASWRPPIPPESKLSLQREGEFEVWREERMVGTESYRIWRSASGDTLYAFSTIGYDLDGDPDSSEYGKQAIHITRTLDQLPLFFQTSENSSGAAYRSNATFQDTVVQVYQESDAGGQGWSVAVPEGKLYLLDPGVYQLVEFLLGDFARRGIEARSVNAFVPRSRTVIRLQLTRGAEEEIEWPKGQRTRALVAEMTDGVTEFKGWFDLEGRLLQLEVPSYQSRIVRRPGPVAERP